MSLWETDEGERRESEKPHSNAEWLLACSVFRAWHSTYHFTRKRDAGEEGGLLIFIQKTHTPQ